MSRQDRVSTSRQARARRIQRAEYRGKLHIDKAEIPPNKRYLWVRETILGYRDGDNVSMRLQAGWSPVPAKRHPTWVPPPLEEGEAMPTLIRRAGMLLMEKDLSAALQDDEDLAAENFEILDSVDVDAERKSKSDRNFVATGHSSTKIERRDAAGRLIREGTQTFED